MVQLHAWGLIFKFTGGGNQSLVMLINCVTKKGLVGQELRGTTLNKPPIGLHVKILNFNGRFEAFSARYGMFCFINRFRIDENLIYVSMFG